MSSDKTVTTEKPVKGNQPDISNKAACNDEPVHSEKPPCTVEPVDTKKSDFTKESNREQASSSDVAKSSESTTQISKKTVQAPTFTFNPDFPLAQPTRSE